MKKPKKLVAFMLAALMVGNSTFAHIPEIWADEFDYEGGSSQGDGSSGVSNSGDTDNTGGTDSTGGMSDEGNTDTGNTDNTDNTGGTDSSGNTGNTGGTGNTDNTGGTDSSGNTGNTGGTGNTDNTGGTDSSGNTGDSGDTGNTGGTDSSGNTDNTGSSGNTGDTDTNDTNSDNKNEGDIKENNSSTDNKDTQTDDSAKLNSSETYKGQEQPTTTDTQDKIPDTLTTAVHNSVSSGGGAVGGTAAGNGIIDNKLEEAVDPLEATLETDLFYAVADETEITYHVTAEGGKAPYYYIFRATMDDEVVYELEDDFEGSSSDAEITYTPDRSGMLEAEIIVMDKEDEAASAVKRIAVSAPEKETEQDWKKSTKSAKLTDDWRKDLIRVAATQLGYTESRKDFTVDDDAVMHRYSRYGAWYEETTGSTDEEIAYRYMDWDTMFISFCMSYAKIPEDAFAPAASFDTWEEQLAKAGAYREAGSGYVPEPGDLIILNEEDRPEHTGIVETISEEDAQIGTIEGDALAADASGEVSLIDDLTDTKATEENTSESDAAEIKAAADASADTKTSEAIKTLENASADTKVSEETKTSDDASADTKASEATKTSDDASVDTKASEATKTSENASAGTKVSVETKAAADASAGTKVSVEDEIGSETVETKASREEKETKAESAVEIVIENETSEAEDSSDTENVKADEADGEESLVKIIDEEDEIIEADERDTVVRNTYSLDDDRIVGYVSMRAMMEAAGVEVIDGEVLESEDGTVRVIGDFPENATLVVTPLTADNYTEFLDKETAARMASFKGTVYFAYDITILKDGTEWQPDKDHPVKVKIALDQVPVDEMEVLHITDEGEKEQITVEKEDDEVTFNTKGLSPFIASKKSNIRKLTQQQTGIAIDLYAWDRGGMRPTITPKNGAIIIDDTTPDIVTIDLKELVGNSIVASSFAGKKFKVISAEMDTSEGSTSDDSTSDDSTSDDSTSDGSTSDDSASDDSTSDDSWTLAASDSVDEKKCTAGYNYADHNFGISLTPEGGKEEDLYGLSSGSFITLPEYTDTDEVKLTFTLHNANAITKSGSPTGVYSLVLESEDQELNVTLRFNITIHRQPAQIHATVPLYVCMYGYGGDGKVVTPTEGAYGISNLSDFPVQITSVAANHGGWGLKDSTADLKAGELFLKLANQVITSGKKDTSKDSRWRIGAYGTSGTNGGRLSIPISAAIAGGNVNEDGESEVCHVTYTFGIPEY